MIVGGSGVGVIVGVSVGVSVGVGVKVSVGVGVSVGVSVGVTVGSSTVGMSVGVRGMKGAGGRITRAIISKAQIKTKALKPKKMMVSVL